MKRLLVVLSCFVLVGAAFAQSDDFQPAKVVAFERAAADAQHPENADSYKISMRLGDIIYKCHANEPVTVFNDWTVNKEFPARVTETGKVLEVKNNDGQIIQMKIVGKKRPK